MRAGVEQLRNHGVRLEQYDLPEVKTEDAGSTTGDLRDAWFRDPDGKHPAHPFSRRDAITDDAAALPRGDA